jgi:hypothetical protein
MWRLALPVIALALLGASFLRAGSLPMVAGCAVLVLLLAWPRWWVARLVQLALVAATLRWIWLTWVIAGMRAAAGAPAARLVAILGAVALLTLLAALVFQSRRLQHYYGLGPTPAREADG